MKYLDENIGTKLTDLGLEGVVVNLTPKARDIKAQINGTALNCKAAAQGRRPSIIAAASEGRRYLQTIPR